jgi:hypothetical protein
MSDEPKTSLFEVFVAILLGLGALGGAWAAYQASQWGSTATESYGKSSTTATQGATQFNLGLTIAVADSQLDLQAKELVVRSQVELAAGDQSGKLDMAIAKYLYTMKLSALAYAKLGLPPEYRPTNRADPAQSAKALSIPDAAIQRSLSVELGDTDYVQTMLATGTKTFQQAEVTFKEGQRVSGISTKFGQVGMLFTVTLFLGGLALVFKSKMRWGFLGTGYVTLAASISLLLMQSWYPA